MTEKDRRLDVGVPEGISVVATREEDALRLTNISKRAFDSDVDAGAAGPGGPPGYDSVEAHVRFMRFLDCYNILLGDLIVGGLRVGSVGDEHKVLEAIFVDPDYHNRGIGRRAVELLWGFYPSVKLWTLGTPEWNVRTKHFYEKLGFVQVGWELGGEGRGRWYEKVMDRSRPLVMRKVGELREGMSNVDVEGTILEKPLPRSVRSRARGRTLTVVDAVLGDNTGRVTLVLWENLIGRANVNDKVRVENGNVSSFRGELQLNIGWGRMISLI